MTSLPTEPDRRVLTLVHLGLFAALLVYGLILAVWQRDGEPPPARLRMPEWTLLVFGILQYAAVTSFSRGLLRRGRGGPRDRVRAHFLLRFAAAEAIGVFGLMLGLTGGRILWAGGLLAASLAALLMAAPTLRAYGEAFAAAQAAAP